MNQFDRDTLTRKEQTAVLFRLLRYIKPYRMLLVFATLIAIIATIFQLLGPYFIKLILDNGFKNGNVVMDVVYRYITFYAFAVLGFTFFLYLKTFLFNELGLRIARDVRIHVYEKLQSLGMRYFDQTPAGSIVSRVTNDTEAIQEMLNNVVSVILTSMIMMTGILVAMYLLNVVLALIITVFIPIALVIVYTYQKLSTKFYFIARDRLSTLNSKLAESISGMYIIQLFSQQKRMAAEFEATNQEYYEASMRNVRLDGILLAPSIQLMTALAIGFVFSYLGIQSLYGAISIGLATAFIEYTYRFFEPMFNIMDRLAMYQQAIVAAYRIFVIMDTEELAPRQNEGASAVIQDAKIEFRNVSFSYDGVNEVLSNISFVVNPGETIALVGHTGSGKSSIINVMMRFYEFYKGDILIDDISIKDYPIKELRSKMGLVLQEPFMFYGSINDNVRLKNKLISDQAIKQACEFVQANDFIEQLSDQYEHRVVERGASFSTGQKQLLAFARTIVTNPKILILDEATANIDTETELLIQNGLEKIRRGRTSIAIAHRLSTIKDANKILVLDKGHIIESGTHDELIQQHGAYYAMYELQKSEMMLQS